MSNMEHPGVAKFTRLLPLSIRKESSGGIGGGIFQGNSSPVFSSDRNAPIRDSHPSGDMCNNEHGRLNSSPPSRSSSEQKEIVRVTLTYPSPSVGALNPHKEISMRITNDENPMFFYHLRITESDYPIIRSQQGLLVDFHGFPNQLITLLEKCDPTSVSEREAEKNEIVGAPKFIMVMKAGVNSFLDFVESNPFKYLCHLSLQINPGSDNEVKKYLADVTSTLKKDYSLMNEKYTHLSSTMESEVMRLKGIIEKRNEELRDMKEELHTQANSLSSKHFQDMTVEKEKLLKLQSDLASKFECERNEVDRRHSQAASTLENRIASLETENRELIQIKFKNETSLQSYFTKVKNLEDDLKLLQQEITATKKQNDKLDHDYHEKQRLVNSLQNRLSNLESDQREKQNVMQRQQDFISQLSDQKKFLEDRTTNMVKELEKLEGINKSVSGELVKANEIIRKLQDDIRSLHAKSKLQNQITIEQERRISDYEKETRHQDDSISSLKATISTMKEDEVIKKKELEESAAKIETLEDTIKSNENMISWLNKQLNEFQGLGNLTKFRQNLATAGSSTGFHGRPNAPLERETTLGVGNNSTSAVNGSFRPGGALFSSNIQNTLPNGTPSWLNIYQGTSTPLDNELSSRFERVTASNNNYSLGRSRLDAVIEKTSEAPFTEKNNTGQRTQDPDEENRQPPAISALKKGGPAVVSKRPPTWAKPRSGKVTLELSAPNRSNPVRRN